MFLGKINIRLKSFIAISFLLINLFITLYHFIHLSDIDINFVNNERTGVKVITPLYNITNQLVQYRVAYFQPQLYTQKQISALENNIEDNFNILKNLDTQKLEEILISQPTLKKNEKENLSFTNLYSTWQTIKSNFHNKTDNQIFLNNSSSFKQNLLDLISYTGDKSNLILDPALDSYYLMDILVVRISNLYNNLDQIYQNILQINNISTSKDRTSSLLKEYNNLVYAFKTYITDIILGEYTTVLEENHNSYGVSTSLQEKLPKIQKNLNNLSDNLYQYLNGTNSVTQDNLEEFFNIMNKYITTLNTTVNISSEELDELLCMRLNYYITNKNTVTYINTIGIFISLLLSYFVIGFFIIDPIKKLCNILQELMQGKTDINVPYLNNSDEIGSIALAVSKLKSSLLENSSLIKQEEQKELEKRRYLDREQKINLTINEFKNKFTKIINILTNNTNTLQNTFKDVEETVKTAGNKAYNTLNESITISNNAQSVNTLMSNISKEISNVSQQVTKSQNVLDSTINQVTTIDQTIESLSKYTNEISGILALIDKISHQVNLLALNATIEASRAGEHGKGFSVVASEVKELAKQSTHAAESISSQVSKIQNSSNDTTSSIASLKQYIKEFKEVFNIIETSIKEQNSSTETISSNMNNVSESINSVTGNIKGVNSSFEHVKNSTNVLIQNTAPITQIIISLEEELQEFLEKVHNLIQDSN